MTDDETEAFVPHVEALIEQVLSRDRDAVDAVMAGVRHAFRFRYQVDAERALLVVVTEMLVTQRDRAEKLAHELGKVSRERDRMANTLVEARKRLTEYRKLLIDRAAASTAKQERRAA